MTQSTYVVEDPIQEGVARLGRHWGLVLTYALITVVLGIMMLVWPEATLVVVAVLFAIQLLIGGIFQIVQAIAADEASGGQRALLGILGALSTLVGLLCLRSPLQTLAVIALIIGAWWVISGVLDLVSAFSRSTTNRGWKVVMGLISIAAGVFVLLQPGISLTTLVWVLGLWLVIYGGFMVVSAFVLRSDAKRLTSA